VRACVRADGPLPAFWYEVQRGGTPPPPPAAVVGALRHDLGLWRAHGSDVVSTGSVSQWLSQSVAASAPRPQAPRD
jgi:hypothetical protein